MFSYDLNYNIYYDNYVILVSIIKVMTKIMFAIYRIIVSFTLPKLLFDVQNDLALKQILEYGSVSSDNILDISMSLSSLAYIFPGTSYIASFKKINPQLRLIFDSNNGTLFENGKKYTVLTLNSSDESYMYICFRGTATKSFESVDYNIAPELTSIPIPNLINSKLFFLSILSSHNIKGILNQKVLKILINICVNAKEDIVYDYLREEYENYIREESKVEHENVESKLHDEEVSSHRSMDSNDSEKFPEEIIKYYCDFYRENMNLIQPKVNASYYLTINTELQFIISLLDQYIDSFSKDKKLNLIITGHSLGAAASIILTFLLTIYFIEEKKYEPMKKEKYKNLLIHGIYFASPNVCNYTFYAYLYMLKIFYNVEYLDIIYNFDFAALFPLFTREEGSNFFQIAPLNLNLSKNEFLPGRHFIFNQFFNKIKKEFSIFKFINIFNLISFIYELKLFLFGLINDHLPNNYLRIIRVQNLNYKELIKLQNIKLGLTESMTNSSNLKL